ncbi:hypothetical protein TH3_04350 [Thalassospira xiamenensis M-5 = DSM 17429]|uniref:Uncharacterized protein n=1 Tax=Thalassospira xiamenensis M-5 = DSM 17429 TaxID=1123366 RepID=A0AB72UA61_9PROT|nr:hypothetical protein TH3_04350 [Thalassospira xiamenensis M-5 = DSM 17429]
MNDKLNYFFVGRPSYKYIAQGVEGAHWEFPSCFIFEFESIGDIKRIFPFDSGAFSKGMYPDYIKNIEIENFMAGNDRSYPSKIIGAFFESPLKYFMLEAKEQQRFVAEYSVGPRDAELSALHRLASDKSLYGIDDRRFTIEVQSQEDVDLKIKSPIAVIFPHQYLLDDELVGIIKDVWKSKIITYKTYSLNLDNIYGNIYSKVDDIYQGMGIF